MLAHLCFLNYPSEEAFTDIHRYFIKFEDMLCFSLISIAESQLSFLWHGSSLSSLWILFLAIFSRVLDFKQVYNLFTGIQGIMIFHDKFHAKLEH